MIPDLSNIAVCRRWAREVQASRCFFPDVPTRTFETIPGPASAGSPELMIYRPSHADGQLPVYVNLHGGGFVLDHWDEDDAYCRWLAETAGSVVINLDYVLAPEHKFPAAIEQTHAVLAWLRANSAALGIDGDRMVVGGHSAGGNIAAAVSLLARQRREFSLRGQIIDFAPLDLATDPHVKPNPDPAPDPTSAQLGARLAELFHAWYLPSRAEASTPLASPLLAPDLSGLPPALVITAEYDVLCAEGDAYAGRLADAGVPTEHHSYAGCGHAFTHVGPADAAIDAWKRMARFLERVLA